MFVVSVRDCQHCLKLVGMLAFILVEARSWGERREAATELVLDYLACFSQYWLSAATLGSCKHKYKDSTIQKTKAWHQAEYDIACRLLSW